MKAYGNLFAPAEWASYWIGRHEAKRDSWMEQAHAWKFRQNGRTDGWYLSHCRGMAEFCVRRARISNHMLVRAVLSLKTEQRNPFFRRCSHET